MEKSLFEGAKKGDKFVTRDGRIATVWKEFENGLGFITEGSIILIDNGIPFSQKEEDYIVSKYQIDEEKLDSLAEEYALGESDYCGEQCVIMDAYKAGYRKAMEEQLI